MSLWYYLFFFCTGLTALILETTFTRQLSLIFGSTLSAVSVVLAVFMGGMALGAAFLSKRADRYPPLRLYGLLEIGVAVFALVGVIILPGIRHIYSWLHEFIPQLSALRMVFQGTLAALTLMPATILMGATLPVLSRGLTSTLQQRWGRISLLYGCNTVGAALGTLLCGFVLIESFGYRGTVLMAMGANLVIGGCALILASRLALSTVLKDFPEPVFTKKKKSTPEKYIPAHRSSLQTLLLFFMGASGLAALGYEVVWFRILTFSVVADVYAFALMLGVYLFGLGGGSLLAAWRLHRRDDSDQKSTIGWLEFSVLEIAVSVLVTVGFLVFDYIGNYLPKPELADPHYWEVTLRNTLLRAFVLIMPTTLLLGYIFPLIVSLATTKLEKLSGQVGRMTAVNTLGAIVGSLGCGFILIPLIGIQLSLLSLAILSALIGFSALIFVPLPQKMRTISLVVSAPIAILILARFPIYPHFGFLQIPSHQNAKLLHYHEGADQTVMVTEDQTGRRNRRLLLNQQQATSTGMAGQRKNQLLGHLPLWVCPEARHALVICFGSGATFGALGLYDLERVDCVEICPAVLDAAKYFRAWNGDVLNKPQVRVIIDDGRSYLLTTKEKYDVITLEPMHPGLKGVSSLYSYEFYEEARKCLNPGGALCQWIPLYSMSDQDARALMATAVAVFPQSSLWIVGSEGILLCPRDSLQINWAHIISQYSLPDVQSTLHRVLLDDPWAILSGFLLSPEALRQYLVGIPILSDDHPFTEYTIPRHQQINPWSEILYLEEKRTSPIPFMTEISASTRDSLSIIWENKKLAWIQRDRGFAAYQQGDMQSARDLLETAITTDPSDRYAIYFLKEIYWLYGVQLSMKGQWQEAVQVYRRASQIDAQDAEAHFYLANALSNAGSPTESEAEAEAALQLQADYADARKLLAHLKSMGHDKQD